MSIPIIGGKLDGQQAHGRVLQFEEKGEKYALIEFSELVGEKKVKGFLYLLCNGPTVNEAIRTYQERAKKGIWGE
jgi:hypothetical protein